MKRETRSGLRRLVSDQRGLTTVEYVIVLCLIAGVAVTAWDTFGSNIHGYLTNTTDKIHSAITDEN